MRLPEFIARKYFFSSKNPTAINIITAIGIAGYTVGSLALIILLSALNGFEKLIFSEYENYYPDLKITPLNGKVISADSSVLFQLKKIPGIAAVSGTLEESAVIQNGDNQVVGLVKGVESNYSSVINSDSILVAGKPLREMAKGTSWISEGLYYKLNLGSENRDIHIMVPERESAGVSQMELLEAEVQPSGIINPGEEQNQKLLLLNMEDAREFLLRENEVSSFEIKLKNADDEASVRKALKASLGDHIQVRNRREQNQVIYKMFNTEKWAAFGIMALVLVIISFNLLGSLSMLVLEKKGDINILQVMGMTHNNIRRIFFSEGVLVALAGSLAGILLGMSAVLLQMKYAIVKTQATFAAAYPVELRPGDLVLVLGLCFMLGVSAAIYPALKSAAKS